MKKTILLKINKALSPYYAIDTQVFTPVDASGVVIDPFLRRRLKDSEIDNCITIVKSAKKISSPKTNQSEKVGT